MKHNNLCKSVIDCSNNLNIKRKDMPQIENIKDLRKIFKILIKKGYKFKKTKLNIDYKLIKPTQKEISYKVLKKVTKNKKEEVEPILIKGISKEYYILDGHHRIFAHYLLNNNIPKVIIIKNDKKKSKNAVKNIINLLKKDKKAKKLFKRHKML